MPGLTLPSFGIITKAFTDFFTIFLKLDEARQARKTARFKDIALPLNEAFNQIHKEYIRWIDSCIKALPNKETAEYPISIPEIPGFPMPTGVRDAFAPLPQFSMDDYIQRLNDIKRFINEEREINDYKRVEIRSNCAGILMYADNPLEKRFLIAIFNYFLQFSPSLIDDDTFNEWVNKLMEENGVNKYTNTPSFVIKEAVKDIEDAEDMKTVLAKARNHLNEYYPQVAFCFGAMQSETLKLD